MESRGDIMKFVIVVGFLLLALFCAAVFLLLTNVTVMMDVHLSAGNSKIKVQMNMFRGLMRIHKEKHFIHDSKAGQATAASIRDNDSMGTEDWKAMWRTFIQDKDKLARISEKCLSTIKIRSLTWETRIGLGDAAATGVAAGAAWSLKGIAGAFLASKKMMKEKPQLSVIPIYQRLCAQTFISCMATFRAGKAIFTGYQLYKEWKRLKNTWIHWRMENEGAPHQKPDGNSHGKFERDDRREHHHWRSS